MRTQKLLVLRDANSQFQNQHWYCCRNTSQYLMSVPAPLRDGIPTTENMCMVYSGINEAHNVSDWLVQLTVFYLLASTTGLMA